ncbi:MAG: PKD domain-containing protein, partial [Phycisphaerae bacterium]
LKVGDPIQFVDETTGPVDTVQWDVDGEAKGATRNPEIRVSTPGEKTVRMTVRGPGGESIATKRMTVQPRYAQPVVSCEATKTRGTAPLTVHFTSHVTGEHKSLKWTFGDDQSSKEANPDHTFETAKAYDVTLAVCSMDGTQPDVTQHIVIEATKPWPVWVEVTAAIVACLLLLALCVLLVVGAVHLIRRRRRKALRLPVHYWAQQAPVCQTIVLTEADEVVELSPAASLRIKRDGKSRNLIVQPLEEAALIGANGQEVSMLSIGDGLLVAVRDASGLTRAIAISISKKPCRPEPAADGSETLPEGGVCGLRDANGSVPSSADSDEFDWGLDATSANVG